MVMREIASSRVESRVSVVLTAYCASSRARAQVRDLVNANCSRQSCEIVELADDAVTMASAAMQQVGNEAAIFKAVVTPTCSRG